MAHTYHRTNKNGLSEDLLKICRAHIELRHFGGPVGMKLIDGIIHMESSDRAEALEHLIAQLKSNQINLDESNA